ncbi:uncharacterized protein LOC106471470 [Limulus polyphemus]|uniref:Uncharacterized protein LOC106471470 n=1 Tax=Limulus polyphemus TaxID=6850 RepID=A0ABM1TIT3_LIMPO|nr:uncharacterized protein LOC106471470 [Limulus polyphemus]
MKRWLKIVLFLSVTFFTTLLVRALEANIEVDCRSDHENIVVVIRTNLPFFGMAYVTRSHKDQRCVIHGKGNTTLYMKIPFRGCNTTQDEDGLFMNRIRVQHHKLIVSAGDGEYDVGCQMFHGDLRIGTDHDMKIEELPKNTSSVTTNSSTAPQVLLRIYDFENDAFVNTVGLGQIVELEITITNGRLHQGRVSDCDAYGGDGRAFAIIRNL